MAITPQQADCILGQESAKITAIEQTIDEALKKSYVPGETVKISIPYANTRIKAELIRRYKNAGWAEVNIQTHSDQREGDWSVISLFSNRGKSTPIQSSSLGNQIASVESHSQWDR